ncbi:hypothetical protein AAC387_Pa03g3909 [Persea americana]
MPGITFFGRSLYLLNGVHWFGFSLAIYWETTVLLLSSDALLSRCKLAVNTLVNLREMISFHVSLFFHVLQLVKALR